MQLLQVYAADMDSAYILAHSVGAKMRNQKFINHSFHPLLITTLYFFAWPLTVLSVCDKRDGYF